MSNRMPRLTIDDLTLLYSEQVLLEFNATIKDQVWQEIQQQSYPTDAARQNAYLNQLLVQSFWGYLDIDVLPGFDQGISSLPTIWPSFSERPTVWSWVSGSAIDIGPTRLVLIPIEDIHGDDMRIPREWVELPEWVGNFYLAAQVDIENEWIQVLGYATHSQVHQQGYYEAMDETYRLSTDNLTDDLSPLWMTYELSQTPRPIVSLPSVSSVARKAMANQHQVVQHQTLPKQTPQHQVIQHQTIAHRVQQLMLTTFSLQRLALPFGEWARIVGTEEGRRSLHTHLMNESVVAAEVSPQPSLAGSGLEQRHNLRQWLQHNFDTGWQALDTLVNQNDTRLALSFRQSPVPTRELMVEGVKLIDFGIQLGHQPVALVIGLCEEADQRIAVRVQLLPKGGASYLPACLTMTLTSQSGKVLQTLTSRTNDNLMQLKRFTCQEGTQFTIQLTLETVELTEIFEVKSI